MRRMKQPCLQAVERARSWRSQACCEVRASAVDGRQRTRSFPVLPRRLRRQKCVAIRATPFVRRCYLWRQMRAAPLQGVPPYPPWRRQISFACFCNCGAHPQRSTRPARSEEARGKVATRHWLAEPPPLLRSLAAATRPWSCDVLRNACSAPWSRRAHLGRRRAQMHACSGKCFDRALAMR